MKCFYHQDRDAVGQCKSCAKGLCPDCVTDLGFGLACKDKHEDEVTNLNLIIGKTVKTYKAAPRNILFGPIFFFFMGVVFTTFGIFSSIKIDYFPVILGAGFIFFAIALYIHQRSIFGNQNKNTDA